VLIELLESARDGLAESDTALRALVQSRLAGALYWGSPGEWLGRMGRIDALCAEAVALGRAAGDDTVLLHVLQNVCFAKWRPDNLAERRRIADEIVTIARRVGDRILEVQGTRWRIINQAEVGDFRGFDADVAAYEGMVDKLRLPIHQYWAGFWRATRALMAGRFDEAEALSLAALNVGLTAQESTVLNTYGAQLYMLRTEQGRATELEPALLDAIRRFPEIPAWRIGLAKVYVDLGRREDTRRELLVVAEQGFEDVPRDALWTTVLCIAAEVCVALEDRENAARVRALLTPYLDRCLVVGFALACTGSVAHYLAILADLLDDPAAESLFEHAIAVNAAIEAPPYLARTQFEYARMLRRRGEPAARHRAAELVDAAWATATELGMASLLARLAADASTDVVDAADVVDAVTVVDVVEQESGR
jgi:hypothetical protein